MFPLCNGFWNWLVLHASSSSLYFWYITIHNVAVQSTKERGFVQKLGIYIRFILRASTVLYVMPHNYECSFRRYCTLQRITYSLCILVLIQLKWKLYIALHETKLVPHDTPQGTYLISISWDGPMDPPLDCHKKTIKAMSQNWMAKIV